MTKVDQNSASFEWLGLHELTRYAAISERTLRAWVHSPVDALPAVRVGQKILIRRSEFDSWLEHHQIRPLASADVDGIVREIVEGVRGH